MPHLSLGLLALTPIAFVACGKGEPAPSAASASASAPAPAAASAAPAAVSARPAAGGAAGACGYEGTYEAIGYACKGEKQQAFPPFIHWTFTMNGTDASFTEAASAPLPRCSNVQPFKATCASSPAVLTLTPPGPGTCDPPNCLRSPKPGEPSSCVKTPSPLLWSVVEHTASSLILTSVEPFKLTTCTSKHKSNPLTVWWQKK